MTTLSHCTDQYLTACYTLSQSTRDLYSYHLIRLCNEVGNLDITEITPPILRNFMAHLRRRDGHEYSPNYQDQIHRTLSTFFHWLVEEEIISISPMKKVRRPHIPKRKSPRLSLAQAQHLLTTVSQMTHATRNLAIICLMLDSGLRRGEVLLLETGDLDLQAGVALVYDKKTLKEREVPLGHNTCQTLRTYLEQRPTSPTKSLFLTTGGTPLTKDGLGSLMYRLKTTASIPELRCHLLRHTFANHYINAGGSLRKLQKTLGHAHVSTTSSIYTDPELKELQAEHARVSPLAQMNKSTNY